MLERYKVILASQSPRRRELLQRILKNFDVVESDLCEEGFPEEEGKDLTVVLAENKAKNVKDRLMAEAPEETYLIIGADTVVEVDGEILGKPKNTAEAQNQIHMLEGRSHQVITGVSILICGNEVEESQITFAVTTKVYVASMDNKEIMTYIETGEPYDKAGGYGIQGVFSKHIERIEGDYNNVVGLPVQRLYRALRELDDKS